MLENVCLLCEPLVVRKFRRFQSGALCRKTIPLSLRSKRSFWKLVYSSFRNGVSITVWYVEMLNVFLFWYIKALQFSLMCSDMCEAVCAVLQIGLQLMKCWKLVVFKTFETMIVRSLEIHTKLKRLYCVGVETLNMWSVACRSVLNYNVLRSCVFKLLQLQNYDSSSSAINVFPCWKCVCPFY